MIVVVRPCDLRCLVANITKHGEVVYKAKDQNGNPGQKCIFKMSRRKFDQGIKVLWQRTACRFLGIFVQSAKLDGLPSI